MYEEIDLETEQVVLLTSLIEIIRDVPRESRVQFIGCNLLDGTAHIMHPHFREKNISALPMDIEALENEGLISISSKYSHDFRLNVTNTGFQYYDYLQTGGKTIPERIEKRVHNYLNGNRFPQIYPAAFEKWSKAESKLWSDDTHYELSIIGHLCREAMQEFVTSLVDKYKPADVDTNKQHDIARLKCVLAHRANHIPQTIAPFIDAIIVYWGTLNDLVQRQEHAAQKEGSAVSWEDAKRVVFHTAVVFLEIDKILSTTA